MLTFSIDPRLFERFPGLRVGGFLVAHLDRAVSTLTPTDLRNALIRAAGELARAGVKLENVAKLPVIRQWRTAFAACGLKPSRYAGSVEALVRRVLEDGSLATPVPVVTLSDAISARRLAPLAGYDVGALPASRIAIRPARPGSDWFVPLGARPTDIPSEPGAVVFASDETVLGWSFNHRNSRLNCLRPETTRAVFFTEAVVPQQAEAAAQALGDLRRILARRGAQVSASAFADTDTPNVTLRFTNERRH
jgi:DNA/RNA-binding domain of Phe-tRNA-synthetase-like protein